MKSNPKSAFSCHPWLACRAWFLAGLLALCGRAAYAGSYINNFAASVGAATPGGSAALTGGQLRLTPYAPSTNGNLLLPDLDPGSAIQSFTLSFHLTIAERRHHLDRHPDARRKGALVKPLTLMP